MSNIDTTNSYSSPKNCNEPRSSFTLDSTDCLGDLAIVGLRSNFSSGRLPHGRVMDFSGRFPPRTLLPEGATITHETRETHTTTIAADLRDAKVTFVHSATGTRVTIAAISSQTAEALEREIRALDTTPDPEPLVEIHMWTGGRFPSSSCLHLDMPDWPDIRRNYPSQVRGSLDDLLALESPVGCGRLILFHGPPGTGKTTALRALIRAWEPWADCGYVIDPEMLFADPSYMVQVASETIDADSAGRWRLLVAEDCDEYLGSSARTQSGAALGRLLNLTDGILGQGFKALVVLTTNQEMNRLHPAITRPGRCMAAIEFTKFDPTEAANWLGHDTSGPRTLAELLTLRGDLAQLGDASVAKDTAIGHYL